MPFKIERALTGLFEHLKLRSLGELPANMAEFVQPVLDVNAWAYKANGLRVTRIIPATAVAAVGVIGTYTQTRDWLVVNANGVSESGGAGDVALLSLTAGLAGLAAPSIEVAHRTRWGSVAQMTAVAAGELVLTEYQLGGTDLVFFPSGTIWTLSCHTLNVGVGPAANAEVLHYEL